VARGGGSVSTPVAARNGSVPIVISGLSGSASATDIAGFGINVNKQYNFSPNGRILNVTLAGTLERYRNAAHARNIATTVAQIGATTHGNVSVSFSSGSQYLRVPDGRFRPFDQQGIGIGYLDGRRRPSMPSTAPAAMRTVSFGVGFAGQSSSRPPEARSSPSSTISAIVPTAREYERSICNAWRTRNSFPATRPPSSEFFARPALPAHARNDDARDDRRRRAQSRHAYYHRGRRDEVYATIG